MISMGSAGRDSGQSSTKAAKRSVVQSSLAFVAKSATTLSEGIQRAAIFLALPTMLFLILAMRRLNDVRERSDGSTKMDSTDTFDSLKHLSTSKTDPQDHREEDHELQRHISSTRSRYLH